MAETLNGTTESLVNVVNVDRPEAGETVTVAVAPGQRIILGFNTVDAEFAIAGDDFVLLLDDGGLVVFQGLISAAQDAQVPMIQIAGLNIGADIIIEQALALGAEVEPIETAAGEEGVDGNVKSGGGSSYDDSFGDLISGLIKQGTIGEMELGSDLAGYGGTEFQIESEFLSDGFLLSDGGSSGLGTGISSASGSPVPSAPTSPSAGGSGASGESAPAATPTSAGSGDSSSSDSSSSSGGAPAPLSVDSMTIITNQATGNLQIPDQLILYLADVSHGEGLSVSGLSYDGVTENAFISTAGDPMPGSGNTWADDGGDHVIFHIGGGNPFYEGSLSFDASNALGASGSNTIEIQNFSTGQAKGYWTLDGTDAGEVLLGLDGRNQIDGGGGDDIIHGGHDSSGDILMGGAGDDVIFGGSGNDNLQGGDGNDTFLMSAGFGRDDVDGGDGIDIISLDSVLTGAEVADDTAIDAWLTLDGGTSADYDHDAGADTITFNGTFSGTIDLGGGNEITFQNIEQIVYTDLV